jgi:Domain of unknown function (DUF4404)
MADDNLRDELKNLHDEIEHAVHKEPLDKDMLSKIMDGIVRIAQGEKVEQHEGENLKGQIEEQAADFEARHPRVAGVLRDVMDVLSKLGI